MNARHALGTRVALGALALGLGALANAASANQGSTTLLYRSTLNGLEDVSCIRPDGLGCAVLPHERGLSGERQPCWSPDGSSVVVSCPDAAGCSCLSLIDVATGKVSQLFRAQAHDRDPAWSPDGEHLAFVSDRSGADELWCVHADGTGLHQITFLAPAVPSDPSYSPDGSRIVFSLDGDLYTSRCDGNDVKPWLLGHWLTDPVWSPDGRRIAFEYRPNLSQPPKIHVRAFDGSYELSLGWGQDPTWSPDGREVAFVRPSNATGYFQVFRIGADGSGLFRVTSDAGDKSEPSWGLDFAAVPNNYCATTPNAVGLGAKIGWLGEAADYPLRFVLTCTELPVGSRGMFFHGTQAWFLPFHSGSLCIAPPLRRLGPLQRADRHGFVSRALPPEMFPSVDYPQLGWTLYFQYLYRDVRGVALSDALRVDFGQ